MRLSRLRPLLYLITNRLAFRHTPAEQLRAIESAARAGCQLIQIREKDLSARAMCALVTNALAVAQPYGARVLVNDRLDVALATGADGVHLRASSLSVAEARAVAQGQGRADFLIGASTHTRAEAIAAEAMSADFVVTGPVYETPSKRDYGPPMGLEKFAEVCAAVPIPVLALGGITRANFREPLQRGAAGIAAIGMFTQVEEVAATIAEVLAFHPNATQSHSRI